MECVNRKSREQGRSCMQIYMFICSIMETEYDSIPQAGMRVLFFCDNR